MGGGGGGGFDPISAVSDAFNSVASVVSDVVQSVGNIGAQLDNSVRQVIPGGWATLGAAAIAIAAPYAAPELFAETAALPATSTGLTTGAGATGLSAGAAGTGLTAGSAAGIAGTEAAAGLTGLGTASTLSPAVASMLSGAQTGALTGGAMGGVNSAIRGTDPLTGILSGALMGSLTGASLSSVNSLLTANGVSSALAPSMSQALVSVAKGVASGADPLTVLENTALSSGLGQLSNAAKNLIGPDVNSTATNIATSAGTGALGSTIKGGDPLTGALSGAGGSAISSAYNSLMAPGLSNLGTSSSSPITTAVNPADTVLGRQLAQEAQTVVNQAAPLESATGQQNAYLQSISNQLNNTYDNAYQSQTALNEAVKTTYTPAYNNVVSLQNTASSLYDQITPLQNTYDTNKAAYEADHTNTTAYNAANNAATQLNDLIPQYNTAYEAFDKANTSLTDLFNTKIQPLQSAFQTNNQALQQQLGAYTTAQNQLQDTTQRYATDLSKLNQISQGQLVSGMNAPEVALRAPGAEDLSKQPVMPGSGLQGSLLDQALTALTGSAQAETPTRTGTVTVTSPTAEELAQYGISGTGTTNTNTTQPTTTDTTQTATTGTTPTGTTDSNQVSPSDIISNIIANQTPSKTTGGLPSRTSTTPATTATTGGLPTSTTAGTTAGTGTGTGTTTTGGSGAGTAVGTGIGAGLVAGLGTGAGTGTGVGTGAGTGMGTGLGTNTTLTNLSPTTAIPNTNIPSTTSGNLTPTMVKGSQIALPLSSFAIPVDPYVNPTYNPNQLQEIQQAANGGLMQIPHLAEGGDDFSMKPVFMKGKEIQGHPGLFGRHGVPLYNVLGHANGGGANMAYQDRVLPQEHNPQFFSEGGLNSMQHRYVQGAGDGTSDSIPAMLANGEFVIPADVVSSLGNGSNDSGAKVLDTFLKTIRAHKKKHDAKHLPPDSKGPLAYLLQAKEKVRA
jgi:hypothetical protein